MLLNLVHGQFSSLAHRSSKCSYRLLQAPFHSSTHIKLIIRSRSHPLRGASPQRRDKGSQISSSPDNQATATVLEAAPSSSPQDAPPTSSTWEIDFCSRPLLDERGKKVWELLICDPERQFEYSEYLPNSKINSVEVRLGAAY